MYKFIEETEEYYVYENNNKYSKYKYTREESDKHILTLEDCKNCTDCKNCWYCGYCNDCENCWNCGCCNYCENCWDIRGNNNIVRFPDYGGFDLPYVFFPSNPKRIEKRFHMQKTIVIRDNTLDFRNEILDLISAPPGPSFKYGVSVIGLIAPNCYVFKFES